MASAMPMQTSLARRMAVCMKYGKPNPQSMKMKIQTMALLSAALFFAGPVAPAASYTMVRSFGVLTNVSGFQPQAPLVQDASGALYGTTSTNEGDLTGTVFKIQPDGTGFQVLMSFSNSSGANPYGGLALSGSTLYGTTYNGGSGGNGTVFTINTDGTGFMVLTNFPAGANLGSHPYAGLILSGSTLYGTTHAGGTGGNGTVFSMSTSGAGLTVLKNFSATVQDPSTFAETNGDGANPQGTLILSGNMLYGTTLNGGSDGYGTVFALNTTTRIFTNLYTFADGNDGANPHAGLALSGGWLFGTASLGGGEFSGTVFTINTNGSGFSPVYTFSGGNDGAYPDGGVTISGNMLYGTTFAGGSIGFGTVFALNTNDPVASFTNLCEFNGGDKGGYPLAGLIVSGGTLYGSTFGTSQDYVAGGRGTLFAVNTNGIGFTNIHSFSYSDGVEPYGELLLSNNILYGTTDAGGSGGNGMVFQVNPDGTGYTVIKNFSAFGYNPSTSQATNSDGANPQAGLVMAGGTLYGTAYSGGSNGYGALFAVNTGNSDFTNLYTFTNGNDGASPQGGLVLSGSLLYGTAANGGSNQNGTVFSINTDGSDFTVVKTFSAMTGVTNSDGANPQAGLALAGNMLYGTAYDGGTHAKGTVFALNTTGSVFTNLHNFTGGNDGANPSAGLVVSGGTLYGTAYSGGSNGYGTVFAINTDGSDFTVLKTFSAMTGATNSDGANPQAGLALFGNMLYGTTRNGGTNGYGTAFSVNTNGGGGSFNTLYTFDSNDGANPYAGLLLSGNALYGTTRNGGGVGDGVVFALTLFPLSPLNIQLAGDNVILTWTNAFFSLQSAPAVTGVYTNVPGAASPYTNAITGSQEFFRLMAN
jgi:uncharacterized repeat protein (TIGR03803 family)